jgi:hypothetical protein
VAWFTVRVNATGNQQIREQLRDLGKRGIAVSKAVLREKTAEMVALARTLAPREEGKLIERIRATRPTLNRDGDVVASVLAAASVIQHEDMTLQHPNGGGPKFIEKAVLQIAPEIPAALAHGMSQPAPPERERSPRARDERGRFM